MEKQIITFSASEQTLTKTGGIDHYASNTVSYVQAVFDLGENWAGFDSVRAVFKTPYKTKPAVLDHSGRCLVPFEVLKYKCKVFVNLVGSISEEGVLTDRLTSYPIEALTIDANASVDNSETAISPTEFEEFVAIVSDDADRAEAGATASEASADSAEASAESALASAQASEASAIRASNSASDASASAQTAQEEAQKITGMVVVVTQLPEGATPTSDWSDGVLTIGIPKGDTGETGATGNGIESAVLNANYTLTLTFTDGTSYTTPSIRGATGATGATGNGISSVTLTSTSGAVKTYTIAFTDGTNTTFDVTDGEVTQAVLDEEITALKSDLNNIGTSLGFVPIAPTGAGSIPMNKSVGEKINMADIRSTAGYYYWIVPCSADDVFTIDGAGGGWTWRLWAFVKSDGEVITIASNTASVTNLKLVAPTGSEYLVMNCYGKLLHCYGTYTDIDQRIVDVANNTEENSISIKNELVMTTGGTKPFPFVVGKTYEIINNSSDQLSVRTRLSPSSTDVEWTSVNANSVKSFTCGLPADGINPWSSGTINAVIKQKDTLDYRISDNDKDIASLQTEMGVVDRLTKGDSVTIEKADPENPITRVAFSTFDGQTYKVTNYGDSSVSFRAEANSEQVYQRNITGYTTVIWECDVDADHISIYSNNDYTVFVENINTLDYRITQNANSIDIINGKIPTYFESMMATKLASIRENMNDVGKDGDTFIFITDIHWQNNAKNSLKLVRYIMERTNINKVVCGGDIIGQGERTAMMNDMLAVIKGLEFPFHNDLLVCFGNHDSNKFNQTEETTRHFSLATQYALMEKEAESYITMMTDYDLSFYYDNKANKTRYIVLDMGEDMGDANRRFTAYDELADVLLSTENGWKIIIVAHIITYGRFIAYIEGMMDAYNARSVYTNVNVGSYNFSGAKGEVVFAIGGHTHIDSNHSTTGGIPVIVTDCDSYRTESTDYPYVAGTDQEQCFDVVTVDYTNETIKCVRIGRGIDRTFTY